MPKRIDAAKNLTFGPICADRLWNIVAGSRGETPATIPLRASATGDHEDRAGFGRQQRIDEVAGDATAAILLSHDERTELARSIWMATELHSTDEPISIERQQEILGVDTVWIETFAGNQLSDGSLVASRAPSDRDGGNLRNRLSQWGCQIHC